MGVVFWENLQNRQIVYDRQSRQISTMDASSTSNANNAIIACYARNASIASNTSNANNAINACYARNARSASVSRISGCFNCPSSQSEVLFDEECYGAAALVACWLFLLLVLNSGGWGWEKNHLLLVVRFLTYYARCTEWQDQKFHPRLTPRLFLRPNIFETDIETFFWDWVWDFFRQQTFWD